MKLKIQRGRDVGIGVLLEWQVDVEADGFSSGFMSAAVGGLHNARTASGSDDEAAAARGNLRGPLREQIGHAARIFVVARRVHAGDGSLEFGFLLFIGGAFAFDRGKIFLRGLAVVKARGAEKDDRVLNLLTAEACKRLAVFGKDAENAAVRAVQKLFVLVREGRFRFRLVHDCAYLWFADFGWRHRLLRKYQNFFWKPEKFSGGLVLAIVNGRAESNPHIEHSQSAAQPAREAAGDPGAHRRMSEEEIIVRPLRPPGNDEHEHAHGGAKKNEEKDVRPMKPELRSSVGNEGRRRSRRMIARNGLCRLTSSFSLIFRGQSIARRRHARPPELHSADIFLFSSVPRGMDLQRMQLFYDFKALMRSDTSR